MKDYFHQARWLSLLLLTTTIGLAKADDAKFRPDQLSAIDAVMQKFIQSNKISGAVTLLATKDRITHHSAVGQADIANNRAMSNDSIFRIASMTKPITMTALMMLVDEGKVSLNDPIHKYLPAFKSQKLKDGSFCRAVTIRDAVTHTGGLARPRSADFSQATLAEIVHAIGKAPLEFEPGTKWQYSSGLTVAGRIVEVVSRMPFETFLKRRLFQPLGMSDTTFTLSPKQATRLAVIYEPANVGQGLKHSLRRNRDATREISPNPSGGLFSTATDLVRFYQLILHGGERDHQRLISRKAIEQMLEIQTDDLVTGFTPGNAWGLGWCIVRQPQGVTRLLFPGTFGHGGAHGTQAWIDPKRGVIFLLLIQRTGFGNSDGSDVRDAFQEQAVLALRGKESASSRFVRYFGYDQAVELKSGSTRVVLCPQAGGRVLEYSLDGKNALYLAEDEKNWAPGKNVTMSAGRFDIGPEMVIPRRSILWSGEWTAEIVSPHSARLLSQHDPATGVQLLRDFTLDPQSSRLTCRQTITNVSDKPVEWCHWSRTFATGNGYCVVPLSKFSRFPRKYVMYKDRGLINLLPDDPNIREREGYLEILGVPKRPKLGLDSYAGWLGYITRDDLLFVKRFPTYPDRVYNEAAGLTISIWYPEDRRVELEPIGPREHLEPGQAASFTEEWFLTPFRYPKTEQVDLKNLSRTVESLRSRPAS